MGSGLLNQLKMITLLLLAVGFDLAVAQTIDIVGGRPPTSIAQLLAPETVVTVHSPAVGDSIHVVMMLGDSQLARVEFAVVEGVGAVRVVLGYTNFAMLACDSGPLVALIVSDEQSSGGRHVRSEEACVPPDAANRLQPILPVADSGGERSLTRDAWLPVMAARALASTTGGVGRDSGQLLVGYVGIFSGSGDAAVEPPIVSEVADLIRIRGETLGTP